MQNEMDSLYLDLTIVLRYGSCSSQCLKMVDDVPLLVRGDVSLFGTTAFPQVSTHGRLKFTDQKVGMGVGACMKKPFIHITHIYVNHRIIKNENKSCDFLCCHVTLCMNHVNHVTLWAISCDIVSYIM